MKLKLFIITLILTGFITCTKDSYNTTPSLKFESVNGTVFPQPSVLNFTLQFTDKEGDVVDTIWVQRVSLVCPGDQSRVDSFEIPNFSPPRNVKGEFIFTYNYGVITPPNIQGCSQADDTSYFRFWMHDKAQHVSDTVESPKIVLLKQ